VGEGRLAPHQKKARRLNASLVFIDESGLLLAPLVRRTWAPCGQTPILYQRGRARDKVSIIAALTLSPRRRRTGLYFSLRANENVTTAWLVPFLRALTRHLRGPFVLVWDRLPGHRAHVVTEYLHRKHRPVALLPPYAPELNPVEIFWAYLKRNPLANFAALDAAHLASVATRHVQRLRRRPELLRSFFDATPLFFSGE
jgi:transposase